LSLHLVHLDDVIVIAESIHQAVSVDLVLVEPVGLLAVQQL
jgi:hypothetical protein